MYSVFIVDDEALVREGIRNKIFVEPSPFNFVGEAADGEIALSMIQDLKPDIIITDIKMPFLDGLELSKMVKKILPWTNIIILSGHDEFEYAKKAISIGIEEYILKPFSSEDLLKSLLRIASKLDEQNQNKRSISHLKETLESNVEFMRSKFLADIIFSDLSVDEIMTRSNELQLDILARSYIVTISELTAINGDAKELFLIQKNLTSYFNEQDSVFGFSLSPEKFVCIIKNSSENSCEENAYFLADAIQHEVSISKNVNVTTSIGSTVERIGQLYKSYEDAQKILKLNKVSSENKIISSNDILQDLNQKFSLPCNDPLADKLKFATWNDIEKEIEGYKKLLEEETDHFSIMASYLLIDVIIAVSKLIESLGEDVNIVIPEFLTRGFIDNAVLNKEIFFEEINRLLKRALEIRNSKIQCRYDDVIAKAKKFINENYSSQDICLNSVASAVNFSPNHFSTIFSQECNITFIEYLTNVRIQEAKKLLKSTTKRSADIAYEVGFNDPHYFSFIFKKNTGISPREYRS